MAKPAIEHGAVKHPSQHPDIHETRTAEAEHRIDEHVKKHPHNFTPVFKELDHLRHLEGSHFRADLAAINKHLEDRKILPHMHIIETGKKDFAVVAEDKKNPKGATIISESVAAPHESRAERRTYAHMRAHGFDKHHNSGWEASAPSEGGARGGVRHSEVGFQIPQGEHKELIDQALKLCGLECSAKNENAVQMIIQHESSWDPNCTNDWDINAKEGMPTQGLMQTRPDVFQRFALAGYNSNIKDPLSNIIAGIRYTENRYGGLQHTPGVLALNEGRHYVPY